MQTPSISVSSYTLQKRPISSCSNPEYVNVLVNALLRMHRLLVANSINRMLGQLTGPFLYPFIEGHFLDWQKGLSVDSTCVHTYVHGTDEIRDSLPTTKIFRPRVLLSWLIVCWLSLVPIFPKNGSKRACTHTKTKNEKCARKFQHCNLQKAESVWSFLLGHRPSPLSSFVATPRREKECKTIVGKGKKQSVSFLSFFFPIVFAREEIFSPFGCQPLSGLTSFFPLLAPPPPLF